MVWIMVRSCVRSVMGEGGWFAFGSMNSLYAWWVGRLFATMRLGPHLSNVTALLTHSLTSLGDLLQLYEPDGMYVASRQHTAQGLFLSLNNFEYFTLFLASMRRLWSCYGTLSPTQDSKRGIAVSHGMSS